jgi:hypothetical protein
MIALAYDRLNSTSQHLRSKFPKRYSEPANASESYRFIRLPDYGNWTDYEDWAIALLKYLNGRTDMQRGNRYDRYRYKAEAAIFS